MLFGLFHIPFLRLCFPSRVGFLFLSSGWVTYALRWERFWYLLGSWHMAIIFVSASKRLANDDYSKNCFTNFLKNATFGLFFIHPLIQYFMVYLLKESSFWTWHQKVVILNVGVYVIAYLIIYFMNKIYFVKTIFGIDKKQKTTQIN